MTLLQPLQIRDATAADLPAINAIYNHYVLHSTCTYQEDPSTDEERSVWFAAHDAAHPVTVAVAPAAAPGGEVVAWASLSRFHPRAAYRHTVEDSVYVRHDLHGRGIGSAMLADLLARAESLGHRSVVALVSADQPASVALHRKHGFAEAGRLREVGHKFGRWLDVVYLQRLIPPRPP